MTQWELTHGSNAQRLSPHQHWQPQQRPALPCPGPPSPCAGAQRPVHIQSGIVGSTRVLPLQGIRSAFWQCAEEQHLLSPREDDDAACCWVLFTVNGAEA